MKKILAAAGLLTAFAAAAFAQGGAAPTATPTPAAAKPPATETKFKVGDMAPDFTLPDTTGAKVKLSDFRGKSNVVLAFYVFAFTGG